MDEPRVPAELLVLLCEALEVADCELEQLAGLGDEEMPSPDTPDDLQKLLDQRVAVLEVLKRLRQADPRKLARLTPEAWQQKLEAAYREELAKASAEYEMPAAVVPVLTEVREQLEEAWQTVRRRGLSDPEVAEAIRSITTKGWAW